MSTNARAEAFAPASMANLGVGFDILGLAFKEPGDTVIAEPRDEPGAIIIAIEGDDGALPREAEKNTASVAANAYLKTIGSKKGVCLTIKKDLPLASGLGSSAASAVAAVVAVNALFGEPLNREELLPACLEGEALVSGYHADNIGPSLLGGIILITGTESSQIWRLPVPKDLHLALVTPNVAVLTSEARAVLPKTISMQQMIQQTAAIGCLIDALHRGHVSDLGRAMERDTVVEPARAHLMPLMEQVRTVAKENGAFNLTISGAGPTLCAVCDDESVAWQVANAMRDVYETAGIGASSRATCVDEQGARVLNVW